MKVIEQVNKLLNEIKCSLCNGTGRNTWHRKDFGECIYCKGSGKPKQIIHVLQLLSKLGRSSDGK
jgi:hypothetical protein